MKLDFLIPGSPTDAFFAQMAFFRLCLDALGGPYRDARMVAVFGGTRISAVPSKWKPFFRNVEVEWASPRDFERSGFTAPSDRRFELIREDCDLAILLDADVAMLNPLDGIVELLRGAPALAGMIAHYHFPWPGRQERPDVDWPDIARAVLGRDIDRPYRYTLLEKHAPATAPFYVNYGVLMAPPEIFHRVMEGDRDLRPRVVELLGDWWAPQVSLALTCDELGIATMALPPRYNFPNDPRADQLYPEELAEVIFLHYLRTDVFDRHEIFTTEDIFDRFCRLELTGSNATFQRHVARLTQERYPFAK